MSIKKMTFQECVIFLAYLIYITTMNDRINKKNDYIKIENDYLSNQYIPHRTESKRNSKKNNKQTLEDLLKQMTDYPAISKQVEKGKIKPHRPEPIRNRKRNVKQTLEDLLKQISEDSEHEEVDSGSAVGSEVWWK